MFWSHFTNSNFKLINKYNMNNDDFINYIYEIKSDINDRKIDFKYSILETNIPNEKINELKNSKWVDNNLNINNLNYDIQIKLNESNIFIKTTKWKFNIFQKRLHTFLKIINYINNNNINFDLYLILSNKKKYINDEIISPKNINSGYTNLLSNEIFIWREEEFEKVTFHEIIHLCNKDHRNEDVIIPINIIGPESYFEAITDFKAIIYNIIYISIITNKKLKSLLNYELFFIKNQAKYINYYLKKNKINNVILQNSPAYSYFILKFLLFDYFNKEKFNNNLFENIFYKNTDYYKLIKLIEKYELNEIDYINFNSGRMTFFELQ